MHSRRVLSLFLENSTRAPQGEVLDLIKPLSNNSCNWPLSSCNSAGAILCGIIETAMYQGVTRCRSLHPCAEVIPVIPLKKKSLYSQTTRGRPNSCLASSFRVWFASQPCNYSCHLESSTSCGIASCLSP